MAPSAPRWRTIAIQKMSRAAFLPESYAVYLLPFADDAKDIVPSKKAYSTKRAEQEVKG